MVSGLVAAESLGRAARLDKPMQRWVLGRTGASLGIGDTIEIEIASANVARRQIDLKLIGAPGQAADARSQQQRPLVAPARSSVAPAPSPDRGRDRRKAASAGATPAKRLPERRSAQPSAGKKQKSGSSPKAKGGRRTGGRRR
jgi:hypothetical protein